MRKSEFDFNGNDFEFVTNPDPVFPAFDEKNSNDAFSQGTITNENKPAFIDGENVSIITMDMHINGVYEHCKVIVNKPNKLMKWVAMITRVVLYFWLFGFILMSLFSLVASSGMFLLLLIFMLLPYVGVTWLANAFMKRLTHTTCLILLPTRLIYCRCLKLDNIENVLQKNEYVEFEREPNQTFVYQFPRNTKNGLSYTVVMSKDDQKMSWQEQFKLSVSSFKPEKRSIFLHSFNTLEEAEQCVEYYKKIIAEPEMDGAL